MIHSDLLYCAVEIRLDVSVLNPIFYVGLDPILNVAMQLGSAVDERHAGAMAPQIKRGDSRRILPSNNKNITIVIRVRLAVVVRHFGQLFARQTELVGEIVISGGDDHLASAIVMRTSGAVSRRDAETSILAHDRLDPFVLTNIKLIMLGDFAVILESLFTSWLLVGSSEWNVANLKQFGRREKQHARGIVKKRIYQAALVDHDHLQTKLLRLDGAGQAGRSGSNHENVSSDLRVRMCLDLGQGFGDVGSENVWHSIR